jgi:hypothetical protein
MALSSASRDRNVMEPLILQKLQDALGKYVAVSLSTDRVLIEV